MKNIEGKAMILSQEIKNQLHKTVFNIKHI